MLRAAGLEIGLNPVRIDEEAIRDSLIDDGARPRDIADALAEFKARRACDQLPDELILASDQILALEGRVLSKSRDREEAAHTLRQLAGRTHHLYSAAVLYEGSKPVWRHVGTARMVMHSLSDEEISRYLDQAWPDVSGCVGAYQAEALGACLFSRIDGDWFSVLGLPLLDILSYLRSRGLTGS